jgi:hypothetical protein
MPPDPSRALGQASVIALNKPERSPIDPPGSRPGLQPLHRPDPARPTAALRGARQAAKCSTCLAAKMASCASRRVGCPASQRWSARGWSQPRPVRSWADSPFPEPGRFTGPASVWALPCPPRRRPARGGMGHSALILTGTPALPGPSEGGRWRAAASRPGCSRRTLHSAGTLDDPRTRSGCYQAVGATGAAAAWPSLSVGPGAAIAHRSRAAALGRG